MPHPSVSAPCSTRLEQHGGRRRSQAWAPSGATAAMISGPPTATKPAMHAANAPAGHEAIGSTREPCIGGHGDLSACPGDCPLCRADVAPSRVVRRASSDDEVRHRVPLVLGMPSIRGSRAIASRSARQALN